jgi:hypothetical protein
MILRETGRGRFVFLRRGGSGHDNLLQRLERVVARGFRSAAAKVKPVDGSSPEYTGGKI